MRKSRHSRRVVPTSRSQYAFALGARTGVFKTRTPKFQLGITGRENRIAVVDDESVWMIERQKLADLLNRPLGSGMAGPVRMENAARTDFHGDEGIEDAERCSYRHEKVAGDDHLRMVANEGCPTLARASAWIATLQILADGSRRNSHAQLQRKLVGDPFLTPRWVLTGHPEYQFSEVFRERRTTGSARFPAPKHLERSPMPSDEGGRLHDHKRAAPVEELCECDHRQTKRCRCPARFYLAFLEQSELFPKEKILGHQDDTSAKEQPDEYWQLRILQELVRPSRRPIEYLRTTRNAGGLAHRQPYRL